MVTASFWFGKNVATISYVDATFEKSVKLAQEGDRAGLEMAKEFSNANKKDTMLEIKSQSADIKSLNSKQDLILDSLRTLQQQMFESRRR